MEKHVEVSILIFNRSFPYNLCICRHVLKSGTIIFFPDKDVCNSVDHGCEHVCVNTDNSYICQCYEGFVLREDEKTCKSKLLDVNVFFTLRGLLEKHVVLEVGLIYDFT